MTPTDPDSYVRGVRQGDRRVLAKTITLIESALSAHQAAARTILDRLLPHTGRAVRLGITGVPGVGKSTFIESFGGMLVDRGHRLAVLAVDPSSSRSGGSILADKTRMEALSRNEKAFIRPSPAGRTLGGVARKTRESMLVCEAAGFDVVIVETVGVGQSETAVAAMVDFFLVLMLTGAGDELQGIKRGVLELADAIAIAKADGDNLPRAQRAQREFATALHMLTPASPHWSPPVLICSAREKTGLEEIWHTVMHHREKLTATGELADKRREQALAWMWSLVEEGLRDRFHSLPAIQEMLPRLTAAVAGGELPPTLAAHELLTCFAKTG